MSKPLDLDAITARREACLRADGTPNLNYNFVLYDGRALLAEVERLRALVAEDPPVLMPHPDQVMVVDRNNTAHILKPVAARPVFEPVICGRHDEFAALYDALDTLAAPWSLLTDRQYRAWPPWPCQTCLRIAGDVIPTPI